MSRRLFTSESVTEGHPDKICDQVSDGVLDAILTKDPMARVACETATTTGIVFVMGEITTSAYVEIHCVKLDIIEQNLVLIVKLVLLLHLYMDNLQILH